MVVNMVYLHENWWEREGSLQGIEPPVRGQRIKTDQRLVLHLQLLCVHVSAKKTSQSNIW